MKKKSIEDTFKEFMYLSYTVNLEVLDKQPGDVFINDLVILRKTKVSWNFINLRSGDLTSIPYYLIDVFKSLDIYCGDRILRMKSVTGIETFIQLMLAFVHGIESKQFETTLSALELLKKIGVLEFVCYLADTFSLDLPKEGLKSISKDKLTEDL